MESIILKFINQFMKTKVSSSFIACVVIKNLSFDEEGEIASFIISDEMLKEAGLTVKILMVLLILLEPSKALKLLL